MKLNVGLKQKGMVAIKWLDGLKSFEVLKAQE